MMDSTMHITMQRLYTATQELYQTNTQTGIAHLLNISPQVVKNWENRGISNQGILNIQDKLNLSSNWIKTGKGEMLVEKNSTNTVTNINNVNSFIHENYGEVIASSSENSNKSKNTYIEVLDLHKAVEKQQTHSFLIKVPDDELQDIGIFKDDFLLINPNLTAQHNNVLLACSNGRGIIARLSIDLKNQYFLKYNSQTPEIMPPDTRIIGVVVELKRIFVPISTSC